MSRRKIVTTTDTAQRLKTLRDSLGLSQREFGRAVGVSGAHVSQVESGARGVSLELLFGLMLVNASADWLLTGEGPMLKGEERAHARKTPDPPPDPRLAELQAFLSTWWAQADEDAKGYLRTMLRRGLPEFDDWLKARKPTP